jgi:hypothetical protein
LTFKLTLAELLANVTNAATVAAILGDGTAVAEVVRAYAALPAEIQPAIWLYFDYQIFDGCKRLAAATLRGDAKILCVWERDVPRDERLLHSAAEAEKSRVE